jgi:urea transport system ATP-binding protein
MLLETHGLTKRFFGFAALDGVNFSMDEGEVRCLIGPNGAGKTTFLNVVTGRLKPTGGRVLFRGEDITRLPVHVISRRGLGMKFQVAMVYDDLTVAANIRIAANRGAGVFRALWYRSRDRFGDRITRILEFTGLAGRLRDPAASLSHGERQWLEIAMVVAADPSLIILDEPTTGMTRGEARRTARLIQELTEEHSMLVTEHDMDFVREIAQKVTVLHQGRTLVEGAIQQIETDARVREIYLGREVGADGAAWR